MLPYCGYYIFKVQSILGFVRTKEKQLGSQRRISCNNYERQFTSIVGGRKTSEKALAILHEYVVSCSKNKCEEQGNPSQRNST
jgi:hypothetical protein